MKQKQQRQVLPVMDGMPSLELPGGEFGGLPGFSAVAVDDGPSAPSDYLISECTSIRARMAKAQGELHEVLQQSFDATGCGSVLK